MKLLIGLLLLIGLALVATSATFLKLRRSTIVGLLVSGGWLGVLAGAVIGPGGLALVSPEIVREMSPLLMIGLGWIGLMIGLQLRRDLLRQLPASLLRLALIDIIATVVIFGAAAAIALPHRFAFDSAAALLAPATLFATASIGWTVEMRSLKLVTADNAQEGLMLRGAASLAAPAAAILFALGVAAVEGFDAANLSIHGFSAVLKTLALSLIAIALGMVARFGLRRADGNRSELLAIFFGVVALIAGASAELQVAPLAAGILVGVVVANLAGKELRQFERFILQAEHTVATLFWIVAGIFIDVRIGAVGLGMILVFVFLRIAVKPLIVLASRPSLKETLDRPTKKLLQYAPIRQSPMAMTLAVTLVILTPSDLNHQLLTIVTAVGLLTDLFAVFAGMREGRLRRQVQITETPISGAAA